MPMGVGCAIAAGATYSLFTICAARVIAGGGSSRTTMALMFGGAGLAMSPVLMGGSSAWIISPIGLGVVAYLGLAATAGAYLLYGHALKSIPVPVVATLVLAEPASATVLAVGVLGEVFDPLAGVGLALLGLALLVVVTPDRSKGTRQDPAPVSRDRIGPRPAVRAGSGSMLTRSRRLAGRVRALRPPLTRPSGGVSHRRPAPRISWPALARRVRGRRATRLPGPERLRRS